MTDDDDERQLRIDLMSAQLDQIRFQMEEARRDAETRQQRNERLARQERRRFIVQLTVTALVTSIAGLTAAATLILHLMNAPSACTDGFSDKLRGIPQAYRLKAGSQPEFSSE